MISAGCSEADEEIEKEGTELQIAPETQKLNWYVTHP